MRSRPILFSAPMVLRLLDGSKTKTRRAVKGKPLRWINWFSDEDNNDKPGFLEDGHSGPGLYAYSLNYPDEGCALLVCPHGAPGDRLWVKETWATEKRYDKRPPSRVPKTARVHYLADGSKPAWSGRTRVSIHMVRWASRITLELTDVRVERLTDISEVDASAEGIQRLATTKRNGWPTGGFWGIEGVTDTDWRDPRDAFCQLWESINGPGSWAENPWVWALTFKRVTP